jgi:hypothetical protein
MSSPLLKAYVHHFMVKMEIDCAGYDTEDACAQARRTVALLHGDKVLHLQTLEDGIESELAVDKAVRSQG